MPSEPVPSPTPAATGSPAVAKAKENDTPSERTIIVKESGKTGFVSWLGWVLFGLSLLSIFTLVQKYGSYFNLDEEIEERYVSGSKEAQEKIAILSVEGVIMHGDGFVKQQIDRIAKDKNVKVVVLRVDSPGGTVTGADYILHHLKELRKKRDIKIVVSMGSIAASGGYYVSMAVGDDPDSIFAEPTTMTGSIGVVLPHYDLSGLLAKFDVKDDAIASHPRKHMMSITRPMPEDHREILQQHINEMFVRFKDIIKEGRPLFRKDPAALDQLATGELFSSEQAVKHGLVDKIGFIEAAIERAAAVATLDVEKCRVVRYERPASLLGAFGGASAKALAAKSQGSELELLLQNAAPRPYYLADPLPTLLVSPRAE